MTDEVVPIGDALTQQLQAFYDAHPWTPGMPVGTMRDTRRFPFTRCAWLVFEPPRALGRTRSAWGRSKGGTGAGARLACIRDRTNAEQTHESAHFPSARSA